MLPFRASLFLVLLAWIECDSGCKNRLVEVKIVPEYADFGTPGDLKVLYGDTYPVECGNELPSFATLGSPVVTYDAKGKCDYMSIVFFDPDLSFLTESTYLHWFVSNIPSETMKNGYDRQNGRTHSSYFPPGTPTGNHRYTFCVYCQQRYIRRSSNINSLFDRIGIQPRSLATNYGLGNPEACTFFYSTVLDIEELESEPVVRYVLAIDKMLGNRGETLLV